MRLHLTFGALLVLAFATATATRKSYSCYKVIQTKTLDVEDVLKVAPFEHRPEFNFWSQPRVGRAAEIMVAPEHEALVTRILRRLKLNPTVVIEDVEKVVQSERDHIDMIKSSEGKSGKAVSFDRYMTFDEIQVYLDELVAAFPTLASVIEIGQSTEGRPLRVLKISNGPGKKALFTDAAIHAREWIAPPVALKIAFELLENYAANQALVDLIDWYILPVANPDGYVYSWDSDRYWRKTRSVNPGSTCIGTDPNRNFDFHWGEETGTVPCGETWPNTRPFSEPETAAMSVFINNTLEITTYVAIHSYGQLLIFPYGHTTELPPTFDELNTHALDAAQALQNVYGTVYEVGTVANVLYFSYGACRDWAYGAAGLPLSYTFELPGNGFGFAPPPTDILPVVTETWEAVKVIAQAAGNAVRP
ncbi:carboxypeptidase B-like [Neocloeon triangulifer]|uniref:carboxypeptidase B-like n=1 Tax=Neocloeon triangulifer TaxID=2078957 RepID=UPI00286F8C32|nr:carboxypeptidase B-like [Neocloeon triangulifer]